MSIKLDQLTGWLKERKITEVECLISDLTGIARGKISPTNKFRREGHAPAGKRAAADRDR